MRSVRQATEISLSASLLQLLLLCLSQLLWSMERMEGWSGVPHRSISDRPGSEADMEEERWSVPSLAMLARLSLDPGGKAVDVM